MMSQPGMPLEHAGYGENVPAKLRLTAHASCVSPLSPSSSSAHSAVTSITPLSFLRAAPRLLHRQQHCLQTRNSSTHIPRVGQVSLYCLRISMAGERISFHAVRHETVLQNCSRLCKDAECSGPAVE